MKTNLLKHYLTERLQSVEQDLRTFGNNHKPSQLHHLRVEIKKIKAIFSFAGKVYKEKFYQNELKPLFHAAGTVRELQIHLQELKTLENFPEKFMIHLANKENKGQELFVKHIFRYIEKVQSFRESFHLPPEMPGKKAIEKYFRKEANKLQREIEREDEENMHRFRTRLKKIMYVYDILPPKLQSFFPLNRAYINKLQKKIGEWHDTYWAIHFLSHQSLSAKVGDHISTLKQKERRQFKTLIKKIEYQGVFNI